MATAQRAVPVALKSWERGDQTTVLFAWCMAKWYINAGLHQGFRTGPDIWQQRHWKVEDRYSWWLGTDCSLGGEWWVGNNSLWGDRRPGIASPWSKVRSGGYPGVLGIWSSVIVGSFIGGSPNCWAASPSKALPNNYFPENTLFLAQVNLFLVSVHGCTLLGKFVRSKPLLP